MKWFKHISDSLDDPFVSDLMDVYGADGYLVFFGVLEIYSREFKVEDNWKLNVTQSYLTRKLHKRQSTLVIKILKHIQNSGKWEIEFNNDKVIVYIPKFTELIDEWSKRKLVSHSVVTPKILKTDKEEDKELDKDIKKRDVISLPDWVPFDTFAEYNLQRKKKLKPQSINRFLKSLKKICDETKVSPEEILNQSIVNGWEGIFPLKENKNANTRPISYRRNNQERQLDPNTAEELDRAVAEYERKTALREAGKIS